MIIDKEFTKSVAELKLSKVFTDIITEMYRNFVFDVMVDLTTFEYKPRESSAFVSLGLASKEYSLQRYFEPRLDTYIRNHLIYGVVEAVLENKGIDVSKPSLPDDRNDVDTYYKTKDYEQIVGCEFITYDGKKSIGYRYTDIQEYKAAMFFECKMLDEIVVIDWENSHGISKEEKKRKYWGPNGDKIRVVGFEDIFIELFGFEEGTAFNLFLRRAIDQYRDIMGISSIPKLTAPMLFQHRLEEENVLKEMAANETLSYRIIETANASKYPMLESESKQLVARLRKEYIDKKLYKAIVGKGDFARSFLTSEYLYHQFNHNDMFDYTAIVSGYLKSVEQLMFQIVLLYIDKTDSNGKLFRIGPLNKKVTLTTAHMEAGKLSATMGNLIHFFKAYPDTVDLDDITMFINCLEVYLDECRNQSFHKHNNYDWERVERIRNNTFVMYLILLGACSSNDNKENVEHFEIVADDRLERIYYWLRKKEMYTFKVKMPGERDYLIATRTAEREFPAFDEFGLLGDYAIPIRCTKEFNSPMSESRNLVISREQIPDELWYITYVSEQQIDFSL